MPPRATLGVVRRTLVRVLAVRELELLREAGQQRRREGLRVGEPVRDRRLVGGGHRERLSGEAAAGLEQQVTALAHLRQHLVVALGPADGRDVGEVLGRCAQHRGAADVDHLDRVLLADRAPGGDLLERIEVDADEVEGLDPVVVERGVVVGPVAAGEDGSVDVRVQRLDPAAEQLWHLGQLLDRRHRDPDLLQEGGRAAAGDELDVELRQPAGERLEALLVVHREQRASDHWINPRTTCGSRRCSTAWTRSFSESASSSGSTGTRSAAITGPVSTPPST